MIQATFEMGRGYWAGAARALRTWLELDPPVHNSTFNDTDWVVQQVGATKLLEQIEELLLRYPPDVGRDEL
jgi:hypothetical protein